MFCIFFTGNMPYDICEDEASLDCIEGEMAARGVTQRLIDTTRGNTERMMLRDLKQVQIDGGDLEFRDQHGATPVRNFFAPSLSAITSINNAILNGQDKLIKNFLRDFIKYIPVKLLSKYVLKPRKKYVLKSILKNTDPK